jgi:cytochrome c oxidase assembly protein subunit 15
MDISINTESQQSSVLKHKYNRWLFYWLMLGCFLIFLMVIVGGITRLTGSGLSITEWKPIMGAIPPLNEAEWNEAFDKYKQIPQYNLINPYFTLNDFKFIFFWEWFHRLLGRIIGIAFIIPFGFFYIKKIIPQWLLPRLLIIFGLGAFQGFLGWFMVKSGLSELTYVSHYRLAAHLLTAFITVGYIFYTALTIYESRNHFQPTNETKTLKKQWLVLFIVLILQIMYGAFVAGLHAGFEINTWPLMNGKWFFTDSFSEYPWILNFLNNKAGVQIVHRYLAYLVLLFTLAWAFKIKKIKELSFASKLLIGAVVLQFILGVITILIINLQTYKVLIGVIHQCGAFVLFTTYIFVLHKINTV